jgi:amidase
MENPPFKRLPVCKSEIRFTRASFNLWTDPESKACFESFVQYFDDCSIQSVQDMVDYNNAHDDITDQEWLLRALNTSTEPEDQAAAVLETRRRGGPDGLDKVFKTHEIDIIAAPADSSLCVWASAAGYPIATMPLDTLKYNGRPFGISMVARTGMEGLLLTFMRACEGILGERPLPLPLVEADDWASTSSPKG